MSSLHALDRKLAEAIAKPAGIVTLDLRGGDGDQLSALPPTIKALKELEELRLEGNDLTTIPEEIEQLKKLRVLRLARNKISDPRRVWYMRSLVVLDLHGNLLPEAFAGHQQKGLELQIANNPIKPGGRVGFFAKMRVLGVDTDALFPIGDRAEGGSRTVEVIHLYGRAPTEAELAEAKQNFPKARIEHYTSVAEGPHIVTDGGGLVAATPGKKAEANKPAKRKLHREQAAHEKRILASAKEQGVAATTVKAALRPCVELFVREAKKADRASGKTRIGGVPDLPVGVVWPEGSRGPMTFVAQIDIGDVAPFDAKGLLPERGLLSFFAGSFDEGAVIFTEPGLALVPKEAPADAKFGPNRAPLIPASAVRFRGAMSLPGEIPDDESGGWFDVWDGHRTRDAEEAKHRMLGHSYGDTEGLDDATEIVLLALGSDEAAKMMWGDAGVLYFCIDPEALAARRWERVHVVSTD